MGFLVPPPHVADPAVSVSDMYWVPDGDGWYSVYFPWLCLHCHTVQPADRTDCRNCGAPKPTQEARR